MKENGKKLLNGIRKFWKSLLIAALTFTVGIFVGFQLRGGDTSSSLETAQTTASDSSKAEEKTAEKQADTDNADDAEDTAAAEDMTDDEEEAEAEDSEDKSAETSAAEKDKTAEDEDSDSKTSSGQKDSDSKKDTSDKEDSDSEKDSSDKKDSDSKTASADSKDSEKNEKAPASYQIKGVNHIYQMDKYPTGCESVSTTVALQYAGVDITVDDFIDKYLEKATLTTNSSGQTVGPGLDVAFIGNPYSSDGCGCWAGAIIKAIYRMGVPKGYYVKNLTGVSLENLCKNYICKDIPVIFWGTGSMSIGSGSMSWINDRTGETVTFKTSEHCLVLTGYDENGCYFSDPMSTSESSYYDWDSIESAHAYQGQQALALVPEES